MSETLGRITQGGHKVLRVEKQGVQTDLSGFLYLFHWVIDKLYIKMTLKDWFHSYLNDVIMEKHPMENEHQFLHGGVENSHSSTLA